MLAAEYFQEHPIAEGDNSYMISGRDGATVTVREVRQSDAVLIEEMHARLSNESLYYRYLGINKPATEDLQRLCSSNNGGGMALVATIEGHPGEGAPEKVIAVACYRVDAQDPSAAEPAILVEDSFQNCGLGKKILFALCRQAIQKGVGRCIATLARRPQDRGDR